MTTRRHTLTKSDPFTVERMDKTAGNDHHRRQLGRGHGLMFAGVTVVTWYPITPSSSLVESLIDYMKAYRLDADGKATFAIVQAEDELAAIGMVLGAGWAGARAMTATAGPGISLMAEFAGLGLLRGNSRGDLGRAAGWAVHRTYRLAPRKVTLSSSRSFHMATRAHPMLMPCSVAECFCMASEAFNLAEQLQTPVFVMSDLDLGMNNWMSEPFRVSERADPSGQSVVERRPRSAGWICALQGRGRRWRWLSHASGNRPPARSLVRARQRTQRKGAIQ